MTQVDFCLLRCSLSKPFSLIKAVHVYCILISKARQPKCLFGFLLQYLGYSNIKEDRAYANDIITLFLADFYAIHPHSCGRNFLAGKVVLW